MEDNAPKVTLMSIHASKGLEFPVVFVVGLEEELFPIGGRGGEEVDLEEERRLFYVAITRAQKELFFSHARTRYKYGEEKIALRSRFLDEVDKGVVRTETGATISQRTDRFKVTGSGVKVEYEARTPLPAKPKTPAVHVEYDMAEMHQLVTGARVYHDSFGAGKIIHREGNGVDAKLTVFFPEHGQKKLVIKFARLRILQ
jgi:DNA helicase-2/ATP-dependent DNA helicase PcrA